MPTTEVLMTTFAGLGIFFFGIKMVTRNLSAMTGARLRSGLAGASRNHLTAMAFGSLTGFIMQSGRTTAFIMASFVQAGMIEVRKALPIVLWSNLGCTMIIFAAIFPIHLFALFLLAAAGTALAFERPKPLLKGASATFGLALVLFGLNMMSSSAGLLADLDGISGPLHLIRNSLLFAFLAGMVLTFVAQSHMAIMLIAVAMAKKGIFGFDETLLLVLGTHAGSSLITYVTGIHFRGRPRQVVIGQVLYNLVGVAIFLSVMAFDQVIADGQFRRGLAGDSAAQSGSMIALLAVALNAATPALVMLCLPAYQDLCQRLAPPLGEESLSQPEFLRNEVEASPVTTLLLAEKEQLRLARRLPAYCEALRHGPGDQTGPSPKAYHEAFAAVSRAIDESHSAMMSREMSAEDTEWLVNQQKRQQLMQTIDETSYSLCQAGANLDPELHPLRETVVEALDTLLLYQIDALERGEQADLDLIDTMTSNHDGAMESIRRRYLTSSDKLSLDQRSAVLQLTTIYEVAANAIGRLASLIRNRPRIPG